MKKKFIKILLILFFPVFFFLNCQGAQIVSKNELMELTQKWKEPKIAVWYYIGTEGDFNYFAFRDIGINNERVYKVNKYELIIEDPFPLTKDWKKWRVMPWGPKKLRENIK